VPSTGTIIAGLVYRDGVLIGADSQTSDPMPAPAGMAGLAGGVRWGTSKLHRVRNHGLVVGFSGQTGTAERLLRALEDATIHPNQFRKRISIQNQLDRIYLPEYEAAAARSLPPPGQLPIMVHGLAAMWAEGVPGLLEHEMNADSGWHDHFHAIGSGKMTGYAVFRALGGLDLCRLSEGKAITALVRILLTAISVEMAWVGEPLHVWRVNAEGAAELSQIELDAHKEAVRMWQKQEQDNLFKGEE
jgi:20S proteasome alpha/beta subunit